MNRAAFPVSGVIGVTSSQTRLSVGDRAIKGIHRVQIDAIAGEATEVALSLRHAELPFDGLGKLYLSHPFKGEMKAVASITFEDGEVWSVEDMAGAGS